MSIEYTAEWSSISAGFLWVRVDAMVIDRGPLMRITPIEPDPIGVAIAAIVSVKSIG